MVGVDKPTNILFVTDIFQEASAARDAGNLLLTVEMHSLVVTSYFC